MNERCDVPRASAEDLAGLQVAVSPDANTNSTNNTSAFNLPASFPAPRADEDLNVEVTFIKYQHGGNIHKISTCQKGVYCKHPVVCLLSVRTSTLSFKKKKSMLYVVVHL